MKTDLISILKTSFILAFLVSGSFFIIKASFNPSVTGAVIGTTNTSSNYIMIGIALFILSLALAYHTENKRD